MLHTYFFLHKQKLIITFICVQCRRLAHPNEFDFFHKSDAHNNNKQIIQTLNYERSARYEDMCDFEQWQHLISRQTHKQNNA